jgi:protein arginine N-methyltransferase 5
VHPRYKREFIEGPALKRDGAFTRSDMLLTSGDWGSLVVSKVSPWIDADSSTPATRTNSEKVLALPTFDFVFICSSSQALDQELTFANHLGVPAVLIPLRSAECCNLARIVNTHILAGHSYQVLSSSNFQGSVTVCI